ncbi:hypothetical protein CXU22_07650 [Akkermansia muciniphila]|uniref:Uncharacterized protein n=1 Tax=Akkermansia muciniphila TaxID=239935 RepID=A0A2N8HCK0_9BACT|nr:hypothetical protein CXU22_07650 [Akkermansia muciniphila]
MAQRKIPVSSGQFPERRKPLRRFMAFMGMTLEWITHCGFLQLFLPLHPSLPPAGKASILPA